MEVYIPDFKAGPDIDALIREFVGEEQELWWYYRIGCSTYLDTYCSHLDTYDEHTWDNVCKEALNKEMLDGWISENAPAFVRELFFSIEDMDFPTYFIGNMDDFPELLEDFYEEQRSVYFS